MNEKEKQIEEMAKIISKHDCWDCDNCKSVLRKCDGVDCTEYALAEHLYNAGYRKQSKGAWEDIEEGVVNCSNCGTIFAARPTSYVFKRNNIYCRHCGAKMGCE